MNLERLRDEFAMSALNGILASHAERAGFWALLLGRTRRIRARVEASAIEAYALADAMLLQRRQYCPACEQRIDPTRGFIVHVSGCTYGLQEDMPTGDM